MSLDSELRNIDALKVDAIVDDLLASSTESNEADVAFLEGESNYAYSQYTIFNIIRARFEEAIPAMLERGDTRQQIVERMTGIDIVAMVVAAYASTEIPESPEST